VRDGIQSELTYTTKGFHPRVVRVYFLCRDDPACIIVPKFWERPMERASFCLPYPTLFNGTLRPYQQNAAHMVMADLCTHGTAIAHLFTGWGKTVLAMFVATCIGLPVRVYVHKVSLSLQWAKAAGEFCPALNVQIITVQKQLNSLEEMENFREGLVIFDECHHYAAHSFSKLLQSSCARYHLALSATDKRTDGLEVILHLYLGRPSVTNLQLKSLPIVKRVEFTGMEYTIRYKKVRGEMTVDYTSMLSELCQSEKRNEFLMKCALDHKDRKLLILTKRRNHAVELGNLLKPHHGNTRVLLGNMRPEQIEQITESSDAPVALIATFQVASEGFDMPCLDALLFATPSSSAQQEVGRVLRSQERQAVVIDVVDSCPVFRAQYTKRSRFYSSQGIQVLPY
jgi:superfamily II DNA or RNA helicase